MLEMYVKRKKFLKLFITDKIEEVHLRNIFLLTEELLTRFYYVCLFKSKPTSAVIFTSWNVVEKFNLGAIFLVTALLHTYCIQIFCWIKLSAFLSIYMDCVFKLFWNRVFLSKTLQCGKPVHRNDFLSWWLEWKLLKNTVVIVPITQDSWHVCGHIIIGQYGWCRSCWRQRPPALSASFFFARQLLQGKKIVIARSEQILISGSCESFSFLLITR